jgi:sugar lactone lactonase YvrE
MTGLTIDSAGALYGALVSFTADAQPGVYKAPATGGAATLFASDPAMIFPNGFAWTDDGTLFVADSAFGGVFRISPDGTTTPWLQDDSLAGDPTACGGAASDLSIGANGIVRQGQTMFISSTNKGVLVKVPIGTDGSAGPVSIVAGPDCSIAGIDGIALDDDGTIIGAINKQNKLVRIDGAGGITTLVEGGKLDFPASLVFAGKGADRALYVTSFAYLSATTGGTPHPSLLRVRF